MILYVYFFYTGLGLGLFMEFLVVCLLMFWAFFPPFFTPFKTGVAYSHSGDYNQKSLSAKDDKSNFKSYVYLPPTSHQEAPGIMSLIL